MRTKPDGQPIVTRGEPTPPPGIAPFFVEEVRKHLERQYGAKALYESGLSVTTTLDPVLQELADKALEDGLRALRQTPRLAAADAQRDDANVRLSKRSKRSAGATRSPPATSSPPSLSPRQRPERRALQDRPLSRGHRSAAVRVDARTSAADLFKPGDLVDVAVTKIDDAGVSLGVTLEQTPLAQAALLAIDNRTGQIRRWSAAGVSRRASSTGPSRRTARWDRRSSRSSTRPRSIAASRRPRSSIDSPISYPSANGQVYTPRITTTSSTGRSRSAGRWRIRATSRRSR